MEDVKFTFLLPAYKARFFQLALESIKNQVLHYLVDVILEAVQSIYILKVSRR